MNSWKTLQSQGDRWNNHSMLSETWHHMYKGTNRIIHKVHSKQVTSSVIDNESIRPCLLFFSSKWLRQFDPQLWECTKSHCINIGRRIFKTEKISESMPELCLGLWSVWEVEHKSRMRQQELDIWPLNPPPCDFPVSRRYETSYC